MSVAISPPRGSGAILALVLVLSVLAGPAVGGAAAQTPGSFSECSTDDAALGGFLAGLQSVFSPTPTGMSGELAECAQQVQEERAEENATQIDLYESSLALSDADDQFTTTMSNTLQLQDIRGVP